ncbi:MAG: TonB-dependent receptor [Melioribacteraceae bacterium]|nr:TonB-dependent receptor [Melioribacteraceae bacterium]
MKRFYIYLIFFFNITIFTNAQVINLSSQDLVSMSLEELMNIKVSVSSVLGEEIFDTPSSVTIIDRSSIEKYNYSTVAEALQTVPGFEVLQTIIDRNVSTARGILQNFYANKVLILIDNIATWQPIYGEGYLERISINDVERIEVLKGPASVRYGSNAYTGVVNIILRKDKKNSVKGFGTVGISNIASAGISANYSLKDIKLFTSFNMESNEGELYSLKSAEGREFYDEKTYMYSNSTDLKNFNFIADYVNHSIHFNWFHYQHSFRGAHPSYISGGGQMVDNHGFLFNYKYNKKILDNFDVIGKVTYDYFKREFPLSIDKTNLVRLSGNRINSEVDFNYMLNNLNFEFGLDGDLRRSGGHETRNGVTDKLISSNLKNDENIFEWSAFTRLRYNYKNLSVLAGERYTNNKNFGDNVSAIISGVYSINYMHSLKLIYAESFRVPTMFELYFEHPTVVGNKNLEPETSTSYEAAYLFGSSNFFIQVLGYYASYENLIQRVAISSNQPNEYRNFSSFDGYGAEVEIKYDDPKVISGYLNYNYLAGDDEAEENNYRFVPDHTLSFGLSKNIKTLFISVNGKVISKVEGHLNKIDPQVELNLNLGYNQSLGKIKMRHIFSVKNITNNKMYIPEYIRQTPNINQLETADIGTSFIYSMFFEF